MRHGNITGCSTAYVVGLRPAHIPNEHKLTEKQAIDHVWRLLAECGAATYRRKEMGVFMSEITSKEGARGGYSKGPRCEASMLDVMQDMVTHLGFGQMVVTTRAAGCDGYQSGNEIVMGSFVPNETFYEWCRDGMDVLDLDTKEVIRSQFDPDAEWYVFKTDVVLRAPIVEAGAE